MCFCGSLLHFEHQFPLRCPSGTTEKQNQNNFDRGDKEGRKQKYKINDTPNYIYK